jgi:hypothetical protein
MSLWYTIVGGLLIAFGSRAFATWAIDRLDRWLFRDPRR